MEDDTSPYAGIGIYLAYNCDNNIVHNNTVKDGKSWGINLYDGCDHNNITFNHVENHSRGIFLWTSNGFNIIDNNTIINNIRGISVWDGSDENQITNNYLNGNDLQGIMLMQHCDWNNISNNIINNMQDDGHWSGQAVFMRDSCNNNTIHNNTLDGGESRGIHLYDGCNWNNITFNNVQNHYRGIHLAEWSNFNTIFNNTLRENGMSPNGHNIYIQEVKHNNLTFNFCHTSRLDGIEVNQGISNRVTDNTVINSYYDSGIKIYDGVDNYVINNTARNNDDYGIEIDDGDNCTVIQNDLLNNDRGGISSNMNATIIKNTVISGGTGIRHSEGLIINNTIQSTSYGIYSVNSENYRIENNTINADNYGIYQTNVADGIIHNNSIESATEADIICIGFDNLNISSNTMDQRGLVLIGGTVRAKRAEISSDNIVRGKNIIVYDDESDITIDGDIGTFDNQIIVFDCENVLLQNLELFDYGSAVSIFNSRSVEVQNNNLTTTGLCGLTASNVNNSIFRNNVINNASDAFRIYFAYGLVVTQNNISSAQTGMEFFNAFDIEIGNNIFKHGNDGVDLEQDENNLIYDVSDIIISLNPVVNISDNYFQNCGDDCISLQGAEKALIATNMMTKTGTSISLENCRNTEIFRNQIQVGFEGIRFEDCAGILVKQNSIFNCSDFGVRVDGLENSTIISNDIVFGEYGILIDDYYANNLTIKANSILNTTVRGMQLIEINNSTITNNIVNTSISGIYMEEAENVAITNNILQNCSGIALEISTDVAFTNITLNQFLNNSIHAHDDSGIAWAVNDIGNYWDNYTGSDANVDGIGDTPYVWISGSAGSSDEYPIMDVNPKFTDSPADLGERKVNELTGSISWTVLDLVDCSIENPSYSILIDNVVVEDGMWESGAPIIFDLSNLQSLGLENGSYTLDIVILDGDGNTIQDAVNFIIPPDSPSGLGGGWIFLIIILSLITLSLIGLLILKKKDPERFEQLKTKTTETWENLKTKTKEKTDELGEKIKSRRNEKEDQALADQEKSIKDKSTEEDKGETEPEQDEGKKTENEKITVDTEETDASDDNKDTDQDEDLSPSPSNDDTFSPENKELQRKFEEETGKNAIYRGRITKNFLNWLETHKE